MKKTKFLSVNLARFLMKIIGFWSADTINEKRLLDILFSYTIIAIAIALWIEAYDFYVSLGEFYVSVSFYLRFADVNLFFFFSLVFFFSFVPHYIRMMIFFQQALTYTACSAMPVVVILMKLIIFLPNRKDIMKLIRYTEESFWFRDYDEFGEKILNDVNKKGSILICCFTCCVQSTVYTYMLIPLIGILLLQLLLCYYYYYLSNRFKCVKLFMTPTVFGYVCTCEKCQGCFEQNVLYIGKKKNKNKRKHREVISPCIVLLFIFLNFSLFFVSRFVSTYLNSSNR